MSCAAIATAAAASHRSCASMKRSSRSRSSALGSPADHSARRAGRCSCIVARARCSALFAAATLVSSSVAVSLAGQPSTSRTISAARCRGGSTCSAARNASSIVSRSTTTASGSSSLGATSSSSRSGYGCSHGTSANECSVVDPPRRCAGACRGRRSSRCGRATRGTARRRRSCSRLRHARRNVSCTASSASSNDASIR